MLQMRTGLYKSTITDKYQTRINKSLLQKYQKHHKLRHTWDLCGVRKARIGKLKTALNLRDFDIKMKHGHKSGNIFHSSCEKI